MRKFDLANFGKYFFSLWSEGQQSSFVSDSSGYDSEPDSGVDVPE